MIFRAVHIGLVALRFAIDTAVAWLFLRLGASGRMARLPHTARLRLEALGPTFVKLGQALGQRRDLLNERWAASLSLLQSQAAPFPGNVAEELVEEALGDAPGKLFATFSQEPLAAGSVAQVHAAQLDDGREVVVKILRPKVRVRISRDMRILRILVGVLSPIIPVLRRHRVAALVSELSRNLLRETDLLQEARNVRLFARAFEGSDKIYIPVVVDELSAATVMTQERSRGRALDTMEPSDRMETVAETFIDFYLQQFFVLGVFHADPHPGNLLIMPDEGLCIHDFGAVGTLDIRSREALLAFVIAFVQLDPDWLADAAIELGLVSSSADRKVLARGIEQILGELKGSAIADWSLAKTMIDIGRLSPESTLVLPLHLASLVRTAFTAEGTLQKMNPKADMLQLLQEAGNRLLADGRSRLLGDASPVRLKWEVARLSRQAPGLAANWIRRFADGDEPFPLPRRSNDHAAVGSLSEAIGLVALAVVALGAYVASAILMFSDRGLLLFETIPLSAGIGFGIAFWLTALVLIRSRRL